jgi:hypothetical protein
MIRAPRQFNGTFISRHFFPSFFEHNALKVINSGRCYDWAYYAHRLFGVQLWTTDFHAWVQVIERDKPYRYFDSETPNGVSNFLNLGCNRRNSFPVPWDEHAPRRMELQAFKSFWDEHGGGHRRHWESMLEAQLRTVLGKRFSELTPIFRVRTMQ